MIIKKEGSITFLFSMDKNPKAFTDGVNVFWGEFMLNGEVSVITSESKNLSVTMNPKTDRELLVFSAELENIRLDKNHVGITWSPEKVCLYFNGIQVQSIKTSDLKYD
jgi:hypothetical protein